MPVKVKKVDGYRVSTPGGVKVKFSWEGFAKLNLLDVLRSIGYSNTEAKRLFNAGAIDVYDTQLTEDGNHFVRYRRKASLIELVEPNDLIFIGKHRVISIKAKSFSWYEQLYYRLRDFVDLVKDIKIRGRFILARI